MSSHDAHDVMTNDPVVGVHPSYPDRQYKSAICELLDRYFFPRLFHSSKKNNDVDPDQKVLNGIDKRNSVGNTLLNPGFDKLKQMADSANIPLYVCLHATLPEFNAGKYDEQGEKIISWCNQHNVFLVKDLEEGLTDKMFRDNIHINDMGQRLEAQIMKKYIK